MIQISINGETSEQLIAQALLVAKLLGGTSEKAILSGQDQARLRGDATVVPPKTPAEKKAAEKAAKKAAEEAAKAAAESSTDDEAEGDDAGDDPLGENDAADEGEALTHDDVKKLLVDMRAAYPKDSTLISKVIREFGKAPKLTDVDVKNLGAVAGEAKRLLKAAKK